MAISENLNLAGSNNGDVGSLPSTIQWIKDNDDVALQMLLYLF